MFERILVPLDGSARAEIILRQIERILNREDAEILLLRVISPPESGGLALQSGHGYPEREDAQRYLHDVALRLGKKASKVHARLAEGWPAEVILETAQSEGATLIAMTTHGRTGMSRWAMGSIAEKVSRASDVPVLLVRSFRQGSAGASEPVVAEELAFRRILVPVDGSPTSMSVIGSAEKFAQLYGSSMLVLHVRPPYAPPAAVLPGMEAGFPILDPAPLSSEEDPATHPASDRFRHAGLYVTRLTVEGEPASEILDLSRSRGMDLVAMATHGRSGLRRWALGSIAERVLRSSDIPLLLIRAPSPKETPTTSAKVATA